jgi:hypothetical protein
MDLEMTGNYISLLCTFAMTYQLLHLTGVLCKKA